MWRSDELNPAVGREASVLPGCPGKNQGEFRISTEFSKMEDGGGASTFIHRFPLLPVAEVYSRGH